MSTTIDGRTFYYPAEIKDDQLPKGRWAEFSVGEDLIVCVDGGTTDNDSNFGRIDAYDSDGNHLALLVKFNVGAQNAYVPMAIDIAVRMFPNHVVGVAETV